MAQSVFTAALLLVPQIDGHSFSLIIPHSFCVTGKFSAQLKPREFCNSAEPAFDTAGVKMLKKREH